MSHRLATPSSRGLGHWPFTPATRVRIPLGSPPLSNSKKFNDFNKLRKAALGAFTQVFHPGFFGVSGGDPAYCRSKARPPVSRLGANPTDFPSHRAIGRRLSRCSWCHGPCCPSPGYPPDPPQRIVAGRSVRQSRDRAPSAAAPIVPRWGSTATPLVDPTRRSGETVQTVHPISSVGSKTPSCIPAQAHRD